VIEQEEYDYFNFKHAKALSRIKSGCVARHAEA
jgi:hypothetical protein